MSGTTANVLVSLGLVHLVLACLLWQPRDFPTFLDAAKRLEAGGAGVYSGSDAQYGAHVSLNPPHLHVVFVPVLQTPPDVALWIWRVLGLLVIAWLCRMELRRHDVPGARAGVLTALIWSPALVGSISLGQITPILLPPVWALQHGLRTRRPSVHGAALGVLLAVKPFFWPLLLWLAWRRHWHAAAAAVATAAVIVLAGIQWYGWTPYQEWIHTLSAIDWENSTYNASLSALALRISPEHGRVAALALGGLVLVGALRRTRALDSNGSLLLMLLTSILISPLGWVSYGMLLFGPIITWLRQGHRWPPTAWLLWIPPPLMHFGTSSLVLRVTWVSAYTWGLLALWVAIARSAQPAWPAAHPGHPHRSLPRNPSVHTSL
jgi:hypothetical protein